MKIKEEFGDLSFSAIVDYCEEQRSLQFKRDIEGALPCSFFEIALRLGLSSRGDQMMLGVVVAEAKKKKILFEGEGLFFASQEDLRLHVNNNQEHQVIRAPQFGIGGLKKAA